MTHPLDDVCKATGTPHPQACSFCGNPRGECEALVVGQLGTAAICGACAHLALDIIHYEYDRKHGETMPAPKSDPPKCDVPGCSMLAVACTDGTEHDEQGLGRVALPNINHCSRHANWAFSHDAEIFATNDANYKLRA